MNQELHTLEVPKVARKSFPERVTYVLKSIFVSSTVIALVLGEFDLFPVQRKFAGFALIVIVFSLFYAGMKKRYVPKLPPGVKQIKYWLVWLLFTVFMTADLSMIWHTYAPPLILMAVVVFALQVCLFGFGMLFEN